MSQEYPEQPSVSEPSHAPTPDTPSSGPPQVQQYKPAAPPQQPFQPYPQQPFQPYPQQPFQPYPQQQNGNYPQYPYPPASGVQPGPVYQVQDPRKSRVVAGLFGILLGGLGVHRFYLGYTTIGIIQLVAFVIGFFLFFFGAFVVGLWGLIEGIMILVNAGPFKTDAKGIPLRD